MAIFEGFSSEMFDFLLELHDNNTISAQSKNMIRYKKLITKPLSDLYETLLPTVISISNDIETEPRRSISSPYTDRRFSPLVPLKEYMYLRFKVDKREKDIPGFYFDMGGKYFSYGIRIYKQTSAGMELLREKWLENTEKYLPIAEKIEENGFSLFGDAYAKDHAPHLEKSVLKNLINKRNFYIVKEMPITNLIYSSELAEMLANEYLSLKAIFTILL
ncbi:MAG: DUF2461 family protein [Clostridia bacterium]|nr:DUF2461 family protein [Clostridia bacterium]